MFAVLLSVGLAQGIAPLFGYCYGAQQTKRLRKTVFIGAFFDILLGIFFMVVFALFAHILTAFFLDDSSLITQSASFLKVIWVVCSYDWHNQYCDFLFSGIGKSIELHDYTLLRKVILFIPGVMLWIHCGICQE